MIDDCPFCAEFSGADFGTKSRVIFENRDFALIPTVGCFAEGYCLYLPKKHLTSFAQLGARDLLAVENDLQWIMSPMTAQYGNYIVVEHGAASFKQCGASCITHAHLHLIPVADSNAVFMKFYEFGGAPQFLTKWTDLGELRDGPYVMLNPGNGKWLVWPRADRFPRQFVRRVCAEQMGLGEMFNWRVFPFEENLWATHSRLQPLLQTGREQAGEGMRLRQRPAG